MRLNSLGPYQMELSSHVTPCKKRKIKCSLLCRDCCPGRFYLICTFEGIEAVDSNIRPLNPIHPAAAAAKWKSAAEIIGSETTSGSFGTVMKPAARSYSIPALKTDGYAQFVGHLSS